MVDIALSPSRVRVEFIDLVTRDLLGPAGGDDEIITDSVARQVRDRYLVGMLAPKYTRQSPSEVDDESASAADATSEVGPDDTPSAERLGGTVYLPSSLGLSFVVDRAVEELGVTASWGRYLRVKDTLKDEMVWKREQRGGHIRIRLTDGDLTPGSPDASQQRVKVCGRARQRDNAWHVTLFLVNGQRAPEQKADEAYLFQAGLEVSAADRAAFLDVRSVLPTDGAPYSDGEERELAMLYRKAIEFATGHGIAVRAMPSSEDPTRAIRLTTQHVPMFEVPRVEAASLSDAIEAGLCLDMFELSRVPSLEVGGKLRPLLRSYRTWIDAQERKTSDSSERLTSFAHQANAVIARAREAADRIEAGIALLETDANASEAFRFANEAMWLQRLHVIAARRRSDVGKDETFDLRATVQEVDKIENRSWRPFQLAFLLLNLPGLTKPTNMERSGDDALIDLLFFPTGGGKTEAYLGLTAYTLAIRRLHGEIDTDEGALDGSGGVAVLMRYTLRLLTAQQFQRAAALICACELLRGKRYDGGDSRWGETPLRIGLWIGSKTTPNKTSEAHDALRVARDRSGYTGSYRSPQALVSCPWCGCSLLP